MQVRKYEASTIKEAVDLVKKDLGPDAIILSTREAQRQLGIAAGKKVIITAAVSEETYMKKRAVEEKLTARQKDQLLKKPARVQKQFIDKAYSNIKENIDEKRRQLEARNYASIPDEDFQEEKPAKNEELNSTRRVKAAVEEALKMGREFAAPARMTAAKPEAFKIDELKSEIKRLQGMVQTMKSKTGAGQVAGVSYPGARHGLPQEMSAMFEKLVQEGFEEKTVAELLKSAQLQLKENSRKKSLLDAWVAKWIYSNTHVSKDHLQNRYHIFVGPRGVGKTSSLVKMASHLVIKEKKRIAIITSDNNKIGAVEQLRIYSQILNVPFAVWRKNEDINVYLNQMKMVDHVLIDTEGQSLLKMDEIENLKSFIPTDLAGMRVHLVMSALLKDDELLSVARRFKSVNYHDVIMTNIDQVRKHGILVTLQQHMKTPYYAFATGPMIPEDFEWASKERVLDLIFKISKTKWEGEKHD